jgi:hypothetical protein
VQEQLSAMIAELMPRTPDQEAPGSTIQQG